MRLAITGGGTGGHVFPALEVARLAADHGHDLRYFGSLRGQEGPACERIGLSFEGFASEPLYSFRSARGLVAGFRMLMAVREAKVRLRQFQPDVLFSTGGFAAAPVVSAARALGIPYVLLEANSVPGRSNAMFAMQAQAIAIVFKEAESHFPGAFVVRTGMPIRQALRVAAARRKPDPATVLIVGGSQGSDFLNQAVPAAARLLTKDKVKWLHIAGKDHPVRVRDAASGITNYKVEPFLEADAMADAYARATVIVSRSGGSLAEVALFGIPSVLVPLPTSAGGHQLMNARAFAAMGAATVHHQEDSSPKSLGHDIGFWLGDPARREVAAGALSLFDVSDATERILRLIQGAAA